MKKRPFSFWLLIGISIFLTLWYLLGQTMAFIHYDFTVAAGLQESEELITEVGVALNKAFGLGDTVIYIPLLIVGVIGLLKRKEYGLYALTGALAITIYWPIVAMSTLYWGIGAEGFTFSDHNTYLPVLSLIAFYGVWGMWYIYKNRKTLIHSD